jgi:hypothetical protein
LAEEYLVEKIQGHGGEYTFHSSSQKSVESFVGYYPSTVVLPTDFASSVGQDDTLVFDLTQSAVPSLSPRLEIRILTTGLGSALDFTVSIDGPSGIAIDTDRTLTEIPNVDATTLRPIFERRLTYPLDVNPALNIFTVTLKPRSLTYFESLMSFSGDTGFQNSNRPWLVSTSIIHGTDDTIYAGNTVPSLTDNRTCMDAPYAYAVNANPVSASALNSALNGDSEEMSKAPAAACGTVGPSDGNGGAGGSSLSLLLGFALMLVLAKTRSVVRPR